MTIRVVASVIRREGRFLVCQRPTGKRHGGFWEFPGGKVEAGETDFQAVERELGEELDVRVREVGRPLFSMTDPGSSFLVHFVPVEIEGQPRALEHSAIAWATTGELLNLPLAPADRRFARHLSEFPPPIGA